MLARCSAPSSMAIYPSKNAPCSNTSLRSSRRRLDSIIVESIPPKILPIRSHFRRKLHLFDFSRRKARDKSGVASQSQAIRLATSVPMRRIAPLGTVAGQPGQLLVIRWLQAEKKNHTKRYGSFFLTGSYLSSQAASSQVLSTYKGLTTVFGMGTGGSP